MNVYGDRAHEVTVAIDARTSLNGVLSVPERPAGIVVMGEVASNHRSVPRYKQLAASLRRRGLATLLIDLLTPQEEASDRLSHRLRFDIHLLGGRLILATSWLRRQPDIYDLPVGLFAENTGAAGALLAAAHVSDRVRAVATRGGRIDLVPLEDVAEIEAPALVIVGGADVPVLAATRSALPRLHCPVELEIIPGAAHLFEQPGALEQVGRLAGTWLRRELTGEEAVTEPILPIVRRERPSQTGREMQR
jgi:putative phosphoribosyl transferase